MRYLKFRPAQTLLETVLAAGVIVAAVVGSLTVIISTTSAGRVSQSQIEAANFAREGIEAVRGIRDSNWLKRRQNVADGSAVVTSWDDDATTVGYQGLSTNYIATFNGSTTGPFNSNWFKWVLRRCTLGPVGNLNACSDDETTIQSFGPAAQPDYFTQGINPCNGQCRTTKYHRRITITKVSNESTSPNIGLLEYLDVVVDVFWKERTGSNSMPGFPGYNRRLTAQTRLYDWR